MIPVCRAATATNEPHRIRWDDSPPPHADARPQPRPATTHAVTPSPPIIPRLASRLPIPPPVHHHQGRATHHPPPPCPASTTRRVPAHASPVTPTPPIIPRLAARAALTPPTTQVCTRIGADQRRRRRSARICVPPGNIPTARASITSYFGAAATAPDVAVDVSAMKTTPVKFAPRGATM